MYSFMLNNARLFRVNKGRMPCHPVTTACSLTRPSVALRANSKKGKNKGGGTKKKNITIKWSRSDDGGGSTAKTTQRSHNEGGAQGALRCMDGRWLRRRDALLHSGFRFGQPTWHLQLSLRGPWLLRLIRLPERTIGVRCRTLVWIQPSFSNWIRSLSGSQGLVLRKKRMIETKKHNKDEKEEG